MIQCLKWMITLVQKISSKNEKKKKLKADMKILLFQWIILWVLLPINTIWGGVAGIIICSVVPLLSYKFRLTKYDKISSVAVSTLSVSALLGVNSTLLICLSYLCLV